MVKYDVTMPFIRMVAGPMDYTQGAMRNASRGNYRPVHSEPMSQGTRCLPAGEYVVFESPITMLCDSPSNYMKEPECFAFMASVRPYGMKRWPSRVRWANISPSPAARATRGTSAP